MASPRFPQVLADRLHHHMEILEAARELVAVLQSEAFERIEACQARRRAAMDRIDALGPMPTGLRPALREALAPILAETEDLDARAAALLEEYRQRVIAQVMALPPLPESLPSGEPRFLDLTG